MVTCGALNNSPRTTRGLLLWIARRLGYDNMKRIAQHSTYERCCYFLNKTFLRCKEIF